MKTPILNPLLMKRFFDFFFAAFGLCLGSPLLLLMALGAAIDTRSNGFFVQQRVGQHGVLFRIFKLRTMDAQTQSISRFGKFLRTSKIDELPQLYNVLLGNMSFVGPRPDVPGYADVLSKADQLFLSLKPGLTGLASLKYRKEDYLLSRQINPLHYNDTVLWPDKVRLNNWYAKHRTVRMDCTILLHTVCPFLDFEVEQFVANAARK